MRKRFPVILGLGLLVVVPAIVAGYFLQRLRSYTRLLDAYECNESMCEADFDGDGNKGKLSIDRSGPKPEFDSWWVVNDSSKELLRLPRRSIDNSLRTHAALLPEPGGARLVVYDHIHDSAGPRSLVFVYNGTKMQPVSATEKDYQLFAAIRASEDTGSLQAWGLFQLLVWPMLCFYYLLLSLVTWRAVRRPHLG